VKLHPKRSATRDDVRSAVQGSNIQLVDARSPAEFRGESTPKGGTRAGHIPSARSLDAYSLVDADGRFLDEPALRQRIREAGIHADQPVIVYSQGGGRSGAVLFALRRLGIRARHYYPGLGDWSRDPAAKIVPGAAPQRAE
jgi:thiosulfate/3-mercaptopyruvate sulfurtransferase